jgi:DNA-binding SARP family transcriptional activator
VDAGYKLSAEHVDLDIVRFDRLRLEGRAVLADDPTKALDLLNEALGLWRGRALQDVEYDEFAQEEIRRLELARVEAVEDRAEALVLVGEEALAIEDLEAQVRSDPSRERPVRLLMRALYRSGRQTEALAVARRHRRSLGDHGLEPSPLVVELEDRILSHDPTLYPDGAWPRRRSSRGVPFADTNFAMWPVAARRGSCTGLSNRPSAEKWRSR